MVHTKIFGILYISLRYIYISGCTAGPDPEFSAGGGRGPILGGFGLKRGHFSVKMYAKTKELGPVGGMRWHAPSRFAYVQFRGGG